MVFHFESLKAKGVNPTLGCLTNGTTSSLTSPVMDTHIYRIGSAVAVQPICSVQAKKYEMTSLKKMLFDGVKLVPKVNEFS